MKKNKGQVKHLSDPPKCIGSREIGAVNYEIGGLSKRKRGREKGEREWGVDFQNQKL